MRFLRFPLIAILAAAMYHCTKSPDSVSISYPTEYQLNHYENNSWNYFILVSNGYNSFDPGSGMVAYEQAADGYMADVFANFELKTVELLSEDSTRLVFDSWGSVTDSVFYSEMEDDLLTIFFGADPDNNIQIQYDEVESNLALCYSAHYAISDNSTSALFAQPCWGYPDIDSLIANVILVENLQKGDTVAVGYFDLIYQ